ncbi:PqqD family protein [Olsenella profusa]|nr:PqqD family protein [Olsenella profusa]
MTQDDELMTYPNLKSLIITEEENGIFLLGNGQKFVQVPEIGIQVISMMDGTRSIPEIHDLTLERFDADIDIEAFLKTLRSAQILDRPQVKNNMFDHIQSNYAGIPFCAPAYILFIALLVMAIGSYMLGIIPFPTYDTVLVTQSSAVNLLILTVLSWIIIAVHESFHILAARSLDLHAEVSLGIRMRFPIVQTNPFARCP